MDRSFLCILPDPSGQDNTYGSETLLIDEKTSLRAKYIARRIYDDKVPPWKLFVI